MPLTIKHISIASYARLKAAEYLPDIEKAIYLDVDILITDSIKDLWNIDLKNNLLAACIDSHIESNPKHKNKIGLKSQSYYFNAGVLLVNLKKWREVELFKRAEKWLSDYRDAIQYQDQDILNGICEGSVDFIDTRFNFMPMTKTRLRRSKKYLTIKLNPLEKTTMPIAITHFCGPQKAWDSGCMHSYANLFDQYQHEIIKSFPANLINCKQIKTNTTQKIKRLIRQVLDKFFYRIY